MDKRLKIADLPIEIHTMFDSLLHTDGYETEDEPVFTVSTGERDIIYEQKKCIAEAAYEGIAYHGYSMAELENTAVYRMIAAKLPEYDGFVFHGSAVAVGERSFLFTAKSGTGKTSHSNLWLKNISGSYIVNGDKPIVRFIDGKPCVCGTPWMGKEGYGCNAVVPLSAVCFINRAEKNRIVRTDFKSVYPRMIGQVYRPENGALLIKTIRLLETIGQSTPIYELYCNMDDEAAKVAFAGMTDEQV